MSHTLQSALESGQEAWIEQIDFRAAFDRVNHQGILYKLFCGYLRFCVVNIDTVNIKSIIARYGGWLYWSKLVNVVSGVPQGSVLGPFLFLLDTTELFSILENKLISYAYDSTLIAVVPSPGVRVTVADQSHCTVTS